MSTKCTILYSRKDDWHFYFDYADMATHFTVKGKETELPDSFLQATKEAIEILQSLDYSNKRIEKFANRCTEDQNHEDTPTYKKMTARKK